MRDEVIHKPKGVVFGPTIVYDAERCIMCTRCIRVSEELAKDPVLDMRERGNLNEIVVAPGRQLDHPYTLMTEYVCPVGALTAIDFRFKARVWFLRSTRSVCVGCATGCNSFTDFDPRNQKVYRYRPRENLAVNKYWMCDEGMLDYRRVHEGRVLEARIRGEASPREVALEKAAEILKQAPPEKTAVVLSAQHSNEDNFALLALATDVLKSGLVFWSGRPPGQGDDILRSPDKNPNAAGVQKLSPAARPFVELAQAIAEQKVSHVLSLASAASDVEKGAELKGVRQLVALASHEGPFAEHARVVLPVSSWAEADGTFTNRTGLTQESEKVITPQGDSKPAWRVVAELARALGSPFAWKKLAELRAAMSGEGPAPGGGARLGAES